LPRRILLADDSVTAQNMGRKILTDAGYEVITVNNGSAALKKIGEAKPDLIVLDVYMPGYSGLEVCFRIKDSRETSGIPVLLTVGKLEPFKQDEARRARADAFIVKPFEASELLAALSKLESNLGTVGKPHPANESPSRSPKDMATFERYASERGPRYGDEESGWKARLKIPSPGQKAPEVSESEPAQIHPTNSFRDRDATDSLRSTSPPAARPPMERPIPAGIPQDITPEEIAALGAAAARVGMGFNGKEFEPLATSKAPSPPMASDPEEAEAEPEVKLSEAAGDAKKEQPQAPAEAQPVAESPATLSTVVAPASVAAESLVPSAVTPPPVPEVAPAPAHADVDAVLSSLAVSTTTAGGDGSSASKPIAAAKDEKAPEPVTVAAAAVSESATMAVGPRWVAEEVPVQAAEAVLVLEKEMHKAFAAFAAAEYGSNAYESAPVDREDEPMFATMAPPAIGSPVPVADTVHKDSDTKEAAAAAMAASAAVGAPSSLSPETARTLEPAKPPAPLMPPVSALDEAKHAVAAFGGPHPFEVSEPPSAAEAQPAAAPESKAAEPTTTAEASKDAATPADPENRREAEVAAATAAAWANWRDIRESVVGVKADTSSAPMPEPEAIAASATKSGFEDFAAASRPADTEKEASSEVASAEADAEAVSPDSLSNMVDDMLAELKPRLMAELAKKLEKGKGKKK
jgi:twitching motility two-component system response regulator PilH